MDTRAGLPSVAVDAGLAVVSAATIAVTAFAIAGTWGGGYWVFGCATGLLTGALTLLRHQTWAAVAGLTIAAATILTTQFAHLPAEPNPATALGLSILIGSALRTRPIPWSAAIASAGLAIVAGAWLTSGPTTVTTLNSAGWLAALATGLGLRLLDTRRRAAVEQVRRDERLELARELHDVVAHHVTGVVLQAQAARVVRRKHPEKLDDSLADIEAASSEALVAMRRVVGLLRDTDDAAPATPGPEQLSELVERFTRHGPAVRLRLPDHEPAWPPEVTSTVYRVVQEALTNITKHAPQARSVTANVTQNGQAVTVEIVDDAPTRHPRRGGGYGLVGMRERVEALGGTLSAGARNGSGWTVRAVLPLERR